jgi:hypothetical protein
MFRSVARRVLVSSCCVWPGFVVVYDPAKARADTFGSIIIIVVVSAVASVDGMGGVGSGGGRDKRGMEGGKPLGRKDWVLSLHDDVVYECGRRFNFEGFGATDESLKWCEGC